MDTEECCYIETPRINYFMLRMFFKRYLFVILISGLFIM
ncbi:hypothetical protein D1BOALGB6SA_4153 [Olavius sp. associated proteobacterium Delta 1]|nr:hypothetical protein D1BOALGB6SA_4153 [Olavius sp. associated proteobacterium Delta 1]